MDVLPSEVFNDIDLLIERSRISNEYRKEGLFCDITIITKDGKEFKAHKHILASTCSYFQALFDDSSSWKEKNESIIELEKDFDSECLSAILDYLYTGKIEINPENALLLHEGAVYFNLQNLKTVISKFPINNINNETVLNLWRYGVKFFNREIENKCLEFINENCANFLKNHLNDLDLLEMDKIVSIKSLKLSPENLYLNIANWIKNDIPNRQCYINRLLKNVDFQIINDEFKTKNILNDKILCQSKDFLEFMVRKYYESLASNEANSSMRTNVLIGISSNLLYKINLDIDKRIFLPIIKHEKNNSNYIIHTIVNKNYLLFLFVDGRKCEFYSPEHNIIKELPALPSVVRRFCAVASLNNRIFIAGGIGLQSTEILDVDAGIWIQGMDLSDVRSEFSLVATEDALYAIGGRKENRNLHDTIEKFNLIENTWESLNIPKCDIGFNYSIYNDNKIYCFTSEGGQILNLTTNNFEDEIPKQPVDWVGEKFTLAYNNFDSFCYVFGKHELNKVNRYIGYKYTFINSTWEDLKIEFPSAVDGDLKLDILNVPLSFNKIKLFNWTD